MIMSASRIAVGPSCFLRRIGSAFTAIGCRMATFGELICLLTLFVLAGSSVWPRGADAQTATGGRHADPALERLLPTTLGGTSLTVESQGGQDLMTNSATFDAFLSGMSKTRADFSLASAYSEKGLHAAVGSWRVKGGEPGALLAGFKATLQASSATPLTMAEETVGGRTVTRIGEKGQLAQGPLYVIVRGDTLLFVQTPDRALADEAMAKLPN